MNRIQSIARTLDIAKNQPWFEYSGEMRAIARNGNGNVIAAQRAGGQVLLYIPGGGKVGTSVEVGPFTGNNDTGFHPEYVRETPANNIPTIILGRRVRRPVEVPELGGLMKDPYKQDPKFNGLSKIEFDQLTTYNGERARGIVHTPEWSAMMAKCQLTYDSWMKR